MAYPYYPYQQNFYQPPMQDQLAQLRQNYQPQQQAQSQSIVWVNNEMEAASYLVAPNSAVTLWDSNSPVVYLKQADASGKPSMKIYDLVERNSRPAQTAQVEYATKAELAALEAKIDALSAPKASVRKTAQKEDAE